MGLFGPQEVERGKTGKKVRPGTPMRAHPMGLGSCLGQSDLVLGWHVDEIDTTAPVGAAGHAGDEEHRLGQQSAVAGHAVQPCPPRACFRHPTLLPFEGKSMVVRSYRDKMACGGNISG